MDRNMFFLNCLARTPEFLQSLEGFRTEGEALVKGKLGSRALPGLEIEKLDAKYPLVMDVVFMAGLSLVVLDPAFKMAMVQQLIDRLPRPKDPEPSNGFESTRALNILKRARDEFQKMNEEQRDALRRRFAPAIFRRFPLAVAIEPDTTLSGVIEELGRLWPIIEGLQWLCYGAPAKRKSGSENEYEQAVRAYDLVELRRVPVKEAARRTGIPLRTFNRRLEKARRQIQALAGRGSPEWFANHLVLCSKCSKVVAMGAGGNGDRLCPEVQRVLGARDGRMRRVSASVEESETKRARLGRVGRRPRSE